MTTSRTTAPQPSQARRGRRARRAAAPAALLLTAALTTLLPAQAADAALGSVTCTGTSHLAYSPGLTFTPQSVTITETDTYTSCASSDPTLTSGHISGSFTVAGLSCANVTAGPDRYPVIWNNGQTSIIAFTQTEATVVAGVQQYVGTGTVTSGEFNGDTAVFTWAYLPPSPLNCLAPGGLTSQDGTVTAVIAGL
ncbi:hypothetical protein [Actinomadura roseirufa]|uniref:hypothetical protein n=1 Tax=Actinomadura roseirufa TaxID=2094049 RepID=UPI0010416E5C|nr:hypothetical protein [Actinomadura roseirufa]